MGPGWWQANDGRWYPPQGNYGAFLVPKKPVYKRVWFWLLMAFAAIIVLVIVVIVAAGTAIDNADKARHTIVYTVTGTGSPSITYDSFDNGHNGSTQISNASLPWSKTIVGSGIFNFYSVDATLGTDGGSITCTLTVDGKRISTNTANGELASATCNGFS